MIKVYYGKKGTGKTKHMLDSANGLVKDAKGTVVYIDDSNELLVKLDRDIRFINVKDYPVDGSAAFLGFICGVASQNYDIETIFIDGLGYIVGNDDATLKCFFDGLEKISAGKQLDFFISINGEVVPPFITKYL